MSLEQFSRRAAGWTVGHRLLGPLGFGLAAGGALLVPFAVASAVGNGVVGAIASLALISLYVGTSVPGYLLGLAGAGRASLLLAACGLLASVVLAVIVASAQLLSGLSGSDCPSCADGLVFELPFILALLLGPLAVGYRLGRRARSIRAALASGGIVVAPPPRPAPGFEFGGFRRRAAAAVVDAIVLWVILLAAGAAQSTAPTGSPLRSAVGIGWLVLTFAYLPVQWAVAGRSLGMRALGLWVVQEGDGRRIGWRTASKRFGAWIIAGLAIGIGYAWIAFDPRKRGWHDVFAGTVVIHRSGSEEQR